MKTIILLVSGLFMISQTTIAKETNPITLNNNSIVNNSNVSKVSTTEEINRVWLNFTNSGGAFKQILVGYITGATNGWDVMYDGKSLDSNPYVDFYSIIPNRNLAIQGRAVPFLDTDEVPLGYKAKIAGTFEISIDHFDGVFVTQDIFLKDITTGVIHNLKNGSYSFESSIGTFNNRFVLVYVDNTPALLPITEEPIASEIVEPTIIVPEVIVAVVPEQEVIEPIIIVPEVIEPIIVPEVIVAVVPEQEVIEPIIVPEVIVAVVPEQEVIEPISVPEVIVAVVPEQKVIEPITVPEVIVATVPAPEATTPTELIVENSTELMVSNIDGKMNGKKEKVVIVSVNNNQITINSFDDTINEVSVYNMGQMQLFSRGNLNTNEFLIPDLGKTKQLLIIKTQLKNGKWTASKVVL